MGTYCIMSHIGIQNFMSQSDKGFINLLNHLDFDCLSVNNIQHKFRNMDYTMAECISTASKKQYFRNLIHQELKQKIICLETP